MLQQGGGRSLARAGKQCHVLQTKPADWTEPDTAKSFSTPESLGSI